MDDNTYFSSQVRNNPFLNNNLVSFPANIPDAINNDCAKCSEKQRIGSEKVMHYIIDNNPNDWEKLEKKLVPIFYTYIIFLTNFRP